MCKFKAQKYFHWFEMWNGSFLFGWISDIFSGCFSVSMWMCLTLFYNVGTWSSIATILLWKKKTNRKSPCVAWATWPRSSSGLLGSARFVFIPPFTGTERDENRIPRRLGVGQTAQRGPGSRAERGPEQTGIQSGAGSRTDRGPEQTGVRRCSAAVFQSWGSGQTPSGQSQRSRVAVYSWRLQLHLRPADRWRTESETCTRSRWAPPLIHFWSTCHLQVREVEQH